MAAGATRERRGRSRSRRGLSAGERHFDGWCSPEMRRFLELEGHDGERAMGRFAVVKALWKYIRNQGLKEKGIYIRCDDELKRLFPDREKIDMFGVNVLLNRHFPNKVRQPERTPAPTKERAPEEGVKSERWSVPQCHSPVCRSGPLRTSHSP
eukprot:5712000-Pyramimonas_sp.AAC.1